MSFPSIETGRVCCRQKEKAGAKTRRHKQGKAHLRICNNLLWLTEKAMAPHSSTLAWTIPWTDEPGRLQSIRIARSWIRLSNFTFTFHFHALEEEMATTPVFLPGESQGLGSLVGCRLWGCTESDTTEAI